MKHIAVMHPNGDGAWICAFPETPSEPGIKAHDQMIFDLGKENDSLRQQLDGLKCTANNWVLSEANEAISERDKLRQQLADITADRDMWARAFKNGGTETMQKQLADSQKREVMLRSGLRRLLRVAPAELACDYMHHSPKQRHAWNETCPVVIEYVEATASASEALTATADLNKFILCEKEPVAEFILDELPVGSVKLIFHSGKPLHDGESLYRAIKELPK